MRILIVDDDQANVRLLKKLLEIEQHEVFLAENGAVGVEKFFELVPDLILMDVMMPVMDGLEASREIKSMCLDMGDVFVPILFLTAMSEEEDLAKCIEAGGDDFLSKPYNRVVLRAKIKSLDRIRALHSRVKAQHIDLMRQQAMLAKDLMHAEGIMSKITGASHIDSPCLNFAVKGMDDFCGDLVIANRTPSGSLMVFLGDFTGHGLPAAVCAVPVAGTFYAMTSKGFSVGDTVREINDRLCRILAAGLFCAAAVIEIDPLQATATIWNGGLPDLWVIDGRGRVRRRVKSTHLALGVLPAEPDYRRVEVVELDPELRIVAISDGVVEAKNEAGVMFGDDRLEECLGRNAEDLIGSVFDAVYDYTGDLPVEDDISVVVIDCSQPVLNPKDPDALPDENEMRVTDWQIKWRLGADTLRRIDPLPIIMNAWNDFPAPRKHRESVFLVLAELYSNALDHGLLELDSELKTSPEGFVEYYGLRETRLADLSDAWIEVSLGHEVVEGGGRVTIRVRDSGPGFDTTKARPTLEENDGHSGRGIQLIYRLCSSVEYTDQGNDVTAVYDWTIDQPAFA